MPSYPNTTKLHPTYPNYIHKYTEVPQIKCYQTIQSYTISDKAQVIGRLVDKEVIGLLLTRELYDYCSVEYHWRVDDTQCNVASFNPHGYIGSIGCQSLVCVLNCASPRMASD